MRQAAAGRQPVADGNAQNEQDARKKALDAAGWVESEAGGVMKTVWTTENEAIAEALEEALEEEEAWKTLTKEIKEKKEVKESKWGGLVRRCVDSLKGKR